MPKRLIPKEELRAVHKLHKLYPKNPLSYLGIAKRIRVMFNNRISSMTVEDIIVNKRK